MSEYEPMNAAELMDRVFDVYKRSFVKQLAFSALIGVISFLLMMLLGVVAGVAVMIPMLDNPGRATIGMFVAILAIMLPIYWIWTATASAGNILLSKQAFYKQPVKIPARKLPGVVLRVLSASLMQLLLSLPWLIVIFALVWLTLRSSVGNIFNDPTALLPAFTTNLWIVISVASTLVYVVYSNVFTLAVPVAIFEKASFHKTIIRSWHLVKGDFWKILGLRILWSVLTYLFTYSAQGITVLIISIVGSVSDGTFGVSVMMTSAATILQYIAILLIDFLAGPLSGILTALIYFNQKIKKEGLDIEIALERLSV